MTRQGPCPASATRRSLFTAGAATAAALALPVVAAANPSSDLANLWIQYPQALKADSEADEETDEGEETWSRIQHIERTVLAGPIRTAADAAAKLQAVQIMFEAGARTDGSAEIAVAQVIAWLQARP